MRFLLSVIICPVFEKTLSEGTDVAMIQKDAVYLQFLARQSMHYLCIGRFLGSAGLSRSGAVEDSALCDRSQLFSFAAKNWLSLCILANDMVLMLLSWASLDFWVFWTTRAVRRQFMFFFFFFFNYWIFFCLFFLGVKSMVATLGFLWVQFFPSVKPQNGYGFENVTRASLDKVVSSKWMKFQFWVNILCQKVIAGAECLLDQAWKITWKRQQRIYWFCQKTVQSNISQGIPCKKTTLYSRRSQADFFWALVCHQMLCSVSLGPCKAF